jgi:protein arginine N-methyltransferase 1
MMVEYHRKMIADRVRNDALYKALSRVIQKGKSTVADIGSGTGLIGFMAKKLGAKEVFLFENGSIMELGHRMAKTNRMKDCHFFHGHSTEAIDMEKVDVIVSETLGNYALEENIIATLNDAQRFLKPGGTIIPQSLVQYACPVTDDTFYNELTVWDDVGYGIDFSAAKEMSLNNAYVRTFKNKDLLDAGKSAKAWDSIDFRRTNSGTRRGALSWKIAESAVIYGVAVWWDCTLVEGVTLSTAPNAPKTHWEQLFFPVHTPIRVKKGDTLDIALGSKSSYDGGTDLSWSFTLNGKGRQAMDLRRGYLG